METYRVKKIIREISVPASVTTTQGFYRLEVL
jgi:hypothetical protein